MELNQATTPAPGWGSSDASAESILIVGLELKAGDMVAERYEILARLGQGGMGTVYKALDHELERVIALKTIRPDVVSNPTAVRRLKQETLLARQIAHRNVVRVFDLGVAGGVRFITMEFVEGENLKTLLRRRGKLRAEEAVAIIKQVCQGLQAAHSEDVIHRDLKPQNILISEGGRVRILDFGLARSFEQTGLTRTGMVLGTPDYMSPEQALGRPEDVRSDIFALGVVFYELLTGQLPFKGQGGLDSLMIRTRERARPIVTLEPSLPRDVAGIVMRCLEREPSRRYQTAQQVLEDLSAPEQRESRPASSSGRLAPGTMLGSRYRIEAEAGEGGMGKVYRAFDLDLNRTVALKIVRPELAGNPDSLLRLKQEISIASRISHRHILRIHDLGEAEGQRFVSMAWADGEDVAELLRHSGPLSEDRVRQLAREICEGLEAAHEQGIVHRDLKPTNVLLDAAGHACIADFGLAHSLDTGLESALSQPGEIRGTPRYMSPEQVEGKEIDHRTDIYSLGLMLYEMATGSIPFKDDSMFQTMALRVTETPKSPKLLNPLLSDDLSKIILKCLERDPEKRYPSAHALREDLRGETKPGQNQTIKGRKWIYAAGITAAAVAGICLALAIRHQRTPVRPPSNARYIAVLPFRANGSNPDLKYQAEGVVEAISERLFSLSSVHPISPLAMENVDLKQPVNAIARKVGANLVVQGNVQGQGDQIAIIASIDNVETNTRLWSRSFSGLREDLLTLEDEICTEIVKALNVTPTLAERERAAIQPTQNVDAYDLYLKGRNTLKTRRDADGAAAALAFFEKARELDPSFALAWTGVADASLELYRFKQDSFWADKALSAAREARSRNNSLPEVHRALGDVFTATGKNAQAVEEIKRALQLEPNSDDGYLRLGRAYAAAGQNQAALGAFKKAVELNPYYWSNHDRLGVAYAYVGRNEDALKQLRRATELNPGAAPSYNNMGVIYLREGRWNDCITVLKKAIEIRPSSFAYTNLGSAYYYLGNYVEAIAMDEKAVAKTPDQQMAVGNLADAYRQARQWDKAQATYDRAIELCYRQLEVNPRNASALGSLALYYARKGGIARALDLINRARAMDPTDDTLMYNQAIVNALAERPEEALNALKHAVENGYSMEMARSEPDLKSIRSLRGFDDLLAKVKR